MGRPDRGERALGSVAPHPRTPLPLLPALLISAVGGLLLVFAYPNELVGVGFWPLALLAPVAPLLALQGRRSGSAALVGAVFAMAFYLPHISWMTEFLRIPGVEWVPWVALCTAMALFGAVGAILITLAYRWVPRLRPTPVGRLLLVPIVVAGLWTLREGVSSVWPYGGFAWGRVGLSQGQGPLKELYAWVGVSGMTFLVVVVTAATIAVAQELVATRARVDAPHGSSPARAGMAGLGLMLGLLLLVAVPAWPAEQVGTIRVAAVQGNGNTAYFDLPERPGDNLRAQVAASEPAFDEDVDVIVWPEGGSDLDPLRSPTGAALFDAVSALAEAPLVSGIITARLPEGGNPATDVEYFNTAVVWRAGEGAGDFYDKRHPVPFGEYVPDREFWRQFAPELIDLIQREYTPGTTPAVLELENGILAGAAICFDIVDDQLMRDMVAQNAGIVFAPTNNGDFGQSIQSVQQLEIARVRALELARTVVNISTVGTSAIIRPDGSEAGRLPTFEAGIMIEDVDLYATTTPAMAFGRTLEITLSAVGLAVLLSAGAASLFRRRGSALER